MRILSVTCKGYYGSNAATEPIYLYFTLPLQTMGHEVETFDHVLMGRTVGESRCTDLLVEKIHAGSFDLVLYQNTGERQPLDTSALADLSRRICIAAWNSNDDWQWEYTSRLASHFTYMVTTYPSVYETNAKTCTNLVLSQWGCLGAYSEPSRAKDIDFSFAGAIYGVRNAACRYLRHEAGLVCFGRGSRLLNLGLPYFRGAFKFPWLSGASIDFKQINDVWNRSRISYCPMQGGPSGAVLSLKSRTFDMGLSGTLMLCEHSPDLERYYSPGTECITFETLEDCAEKARWYSAHEPERSRIAHNYHERTRKEHLWDHRFIDMFIHFGLN